MFTFGSVIVAYVPLKQQLISSPKPILHYAVGTGMGRQGGLRLFNSATKREIIRQTYKVIGLTPQAQTRPGCKQAENGDVTEAPVFNYKSLIGTRHRDID